MLLHATGVVRDGSALVLIGPSGAGKSDLALRLIDRGWRLLADDQVLLVREDDRLIANAPDTIRGLIEVRELGILALDTAEPAPVALAVDLAQPSVRFPEPASRTWLGIAVPCIALDPWPASAAIKVEHAFARALPALKR